MHIHCAKPGVVIGKGGAEIEKLKAFCSKITNKPVIINIVEVKNSDTNAKLVAENIALQLEKRVSFRRALKQAMGRAMKSGAKGIKTQYTSRYIRSHTTNRRTKEDMQSCSNQLWPNKGYRG